jgi:natural product precursor
MKKISLRGISEILSEKELKNVMGGCDGKCIAIKAINSTEYRCFTSSTEAENYAGYYGWWCCNCADALNVC